MKGLINEVLASDPNRSYLRNSLQARMSTKVQQLQPFRQIMKISLVFPREWRGEQNFSLLYRARLLLLNSRIWGFLHLLLESRFLSLSLTLFLSFCQKNCVLRVWHSVLWRCYQFRFFWPMVIFWQTILLRFYALLLFWNYDRIMMTEKTHK